VVEPTLALWLAVATGFALNAYVLLAGADFGGGVWDLLASGPRRGRQRELIADAIGPIWEANHVWLILAIVLLFTCFPPAFARVAIALHVPITLMLVGIVLRGSAFTFRTYDSQRDEVQRRWGRIFAYASLITPLLIGICVGAIASGRVAATPAPGFVAGYVTPWLTPFTLATGVLTLVLFAFLAAVYLTLEAEDPALREDFRRRALAAGMALFAAAAITFVLAHREAPQLWRGLALVATAAAAHIATAVAAITAFAALWRRRYGIARIAAAAQASLIFWGWPASQYPFIIPPDLTLAQAAAPPITLGLILGALALGGIVLFPSLFYLMRVFKTQGAPHAGTTEAWEERSGR
jgi:cytochrome d ubiquinol oxidase subunit II